MLVLIEPFAALGGMLSIVVALIGIVIYAIMAGKTNYANVGIGMGISVLGLMCMIITILCAFYQIKNGKTKKMKLFGLAELIVVIVAGVVGYFLPAYNNALTVQYSNIMSIFVTPIYVYVILVIINAIVEFEGTGAVAATISLAISLVAFVLLGSIIVGINYTFDNTAFLNWADEHYSYYDKWQIERRKEEFGADDFNTVMPKALEKFKEEYSKKNLSPEEMKKEFFESKKYGTVCEHTYKLRRYIEDKTNPNIVTCEFVDPYQFGENHKDPIYYCKIDLSSFTYLGKLPYLYDIPEKLVGAIEKGNWSAVWTLEYGVARCKSEGAEITQENLKNYLKEIESDFYCNSVKQAENGKLKVVMCNHTELGGAPETFNVDLSTYEVKFAEQ